MINCNNYPLRQGKSTMNIAMAKFYMSQGKKVVFLTVNQPMTITMLRQHFPKALFELVGDKGVIIHDKTLPRF